MKKILTLVAFLAVNSAMAIDLPVLCKNNDNNKVNLVHKDSYYRPQDFEVVLPPQDFIASLKDTVALLKKSNTKLIALILPPKGIVDSVPEENYTNKSLTSSKILSDYKTLLRIFSESGVIAPDLFEFSKSKPIIPFFLKTDHHWNNDVLDRLSVYTTSMIPKGTSLEMISGDISQKLITYRGSLAKIVDDSCGKSPASDVRMQSYKISYPNLGLLDEINPQVALIGTSNSRRPLSDGTIEESFASLLAKNGKFAVYNGAIDGGGPYAAFENYFLNQYNLGKPKIIIWEFYAYEPPISSDFLKVLQPLIDADKITVIDSKKISSQNKISSANLVSKRVSNYIRVRADDKSVTNFNIRITSKNINVTKNVYRSDRVKNNGSFLIYIGDTNDTNFELKFDRLINGSVDLIKF